MLLYYINTLKIRKILFLLDFLKNKSYICVLIHKFIVLSYILNSILEDFLGDCLDYNESTEQARYNCPNCSEDKGLTNGDGKGNLEVNYELGVYKCWGCKDTNNMSGYIPSLIRRYGQTKHLKQYLILKPDTKRSEYETEKVRVEVKLPDSFLSLKNKYIYDSKYHDAINYLNKRRITQDIIDYYNLGYTTTGKHFLRVVVPSCDAYDELNYFSARSFSWVKPKYLNDKSDKSTIIFNEGKINWDATIYLVEGPFDHIVTPNSIPLLGKFISDLLLETLIEKAKSNIVIVLDPDAEKDAENLYKKLFYTPIGHQVKIVFLPEDYDIAKIHEEFGRKGVIKMLRTATRLSRFKY